MPHLCRTFAAETYWKDGEMRNKLRERAAPGFLSVQRAGDSPTWPHGTWLMWWHWTSR